ncbi:MAG: LacI family DNA-binding transcriptional regulator [Clostridium sp.]|nr:LacI family DNA-binding transcriptional regulator [Clostridium sp.]
MNIYDIAREAGVSITTVSRVLNNKANVSEKTRRKIQEVLERHSYQPSAIARGLVSGTMKTVAILMVDVRTPHYAMTAFTMEQKLSKLGYMVLLCNTGENREDWKRYLRELYERKADGIILVGSIYKQLEEDDALDLVRGIPIVMSNGKIDRENVYSVMVDEGRGIELATEHLYRRGHRKIAYVKDKQTESAERKKNGYLRKMAELGLPEEDRTVCEIEYTAEAGARIALSLHDKGYDAVVFGEDLTAVGAVNGLLDAGIAVPGEMAVTGCNNSEYATLCRPGLTSINNKAEVLSELSVQLLVDILAEKTEIAELVVIPELVVRGTS